MEKYNKDHNYGVLSGRNIDDMLNTTRALDGQDEKRNPIDFALWKCAQPEHIMRCLLRGATVSPDGTANVRLWVKSIWANISISTVAAWI